MKKGFYFAAGALTVIGGAVLAYKAIKKLAECADFECDCCGECHCECDEHDHEACTCHCASEEAPKAVEIPVEEVKTEDIPVEEDAVEPIEKVVEPIE